MISRETIKKDVIEYLSELNCVPEIKEDDSTDRYGLDDFDLIDMEVFLERKYNKTSTGEQSARLHPFDTVGQTIDKLYKFFNGRE